MSKYIGMSSCRCGEPIISYLTGNIKPCNEHTGKMCFLWEIVPGVICPRCGTTQLFLHQPEGKQGSSSKVETEIENEVVFMIS